MKFLKIKKEKEGLAFGLLMNRLYWVGLEMRFELHLIN